jgi:hypothetical protein
MRRSKLAISLLALSVSALLAIGLLAAGCGGGEGDEGSPSPAAAATQKAAIQEYCDANGITMADLNVSGDDGYGDQPTVSAQDPSWEIDYAFPAAQEGGGRFFLLHRADGGWTVVAATQEVGWTTAQLQELGAPTDIVIDPTRDPAATQKQAIEAYCTSAGIDIPDMVVNTEDADSEPPLVSKEDPSWEVDYAFPADAEGRGVFFLVRKVDGSYKVIADTRKAGWTAKQLEELGAPTDLTLDQSQ